MGDADRGFGKRQPGGWMYHILPYVEDQAIFDLGKGITPWNAVAKKAAHSQRNMTPLSMFLCPTRGRLRLLPEYERWSFAWNCNFSDVAAFDYSANTGDDGHALHPSPGGPKSLAEGDNSSDWRDITEGLSAHLPARNWTGIIFQRSEIAVKHVTDGTSATYMFGEKYAGIDYYNNTSGFIGHGRGPLWGFGTDTNNWTGEFDTPLQNRAGYYSKYRFGSAHSGGFYMAYCDGSVRMIGYDIDAMVHRQLGVRNDGAVVDPSDY